MKRALLNTVAAVIVLLTCGCHVSATTPPLAPGAVNTFDQTSYTTLITTKSVIDSLKASIQATASLAVIKPYLNQAITDYNVAEVAWQTYHAAATTANAATLTTAIAAVQTDVSNIQKAIIQ